MRTRAALRVHDHLRRRHHPKADRRSASHAGDERGNRPASARLWNSNKADRSLLMLVPESSGLVGV
jgi:hypothetical protein